MTQEELLEYNKRCTEFLGCTFQIKSLFEFDEDTETIFYEEFSKPLWWNDTYNHRYGFLSYQRTDYMMYHSDWNWIMEMVEAIETRTFKVTHHRRGTKQSDVYFIDCYRNHPDFPKGWECSVTTTTMGDIYKNDELLFPTKKQAVVKAINEFLIWYENESKTN